MQWTGSIIATRGGIIVGTTVLFMVEADMNGATQFWKVAIEIAEKELDIAAEEFIVFPGEVP